MSTGEDRLLAGITALFHAVDPFTPGMVDGYGKGGFAYMP